MAIEDVADKQALKNFILEVLAQQPKGAVLKLMTGGSGVVAYGSQTLTWGGSSTDATASVTHNLSAAPVNIQLTAVSTGPTLHALRYESVGGTTFTIRAIATSTPGAGITTSVSWWAAI